MSFSSVVIGGRLSRGPEMKYLGANNTALCQFGLAFGDKFKGEDRPAFIDVNVWGKSAEFVSQNFAKGQECIVIGSLEMEEWQDKASGQKRSKMTVNARDVKFAGQKPAREYGVDNPTYGQPKRETSEPEHSRSGPEGDDIPF